MAKEINTYQAHTQEGILLNANESWEGLDIETIAQIQKELPSVLFHRYPQDDQSRLYQAYANLMRLDVDTIMAGNGSDALLGLMIGNFCSKGKKVYTFLPDFSMYDYYASNYEATLEKYICQEDGSLDVDAFIQEGKEKDVNLIVFSNPNNPTGHCLKKEQVLQIVESFPNIPVIVDEAYMDFSNQSVMDQINNYSNLYVTRTLSKAYGLAGIRIGFVISQKENIDVLKQTRVPYTVNRLSQLVASIALENAQQFGMRIQQTIFFRDEMLNKLSLLRGITIYESQANFLYGKAENKTLLMDMMEQAGIVIRDFKGTDYFRFSLGSKDENEKVLQVFMNYAKETLR